MMVLALLLWRDYAPPLGVINLWDDPLQNLQVVWGPALVLGLAISAYIARMTRSSLLEVIRQDYVRTARAKGVPELFVVARHALRNALLPVVIIVGLRFGYMLGGAVVTEEVFAWPGMGRLLVTAVGQRDIPLIQGALLVFATSFIVVNIAVDLLYGYLDPQIRYQ